MSGGASRGERVLCLGLGRMSQGIALHYACRGVAVTMLDCRVRPAGGFAERAAEVWDELEAGWALIGRIGLCPAPEDLRSLIVLENLFTGDITWQADDLIFECVPEDIAIKHETLRAVSERCASGALIASTTSTIMVDDLLPAVVHPERFLNAHWLNPAFLIPLVEVSPSTQTDPARLEQLLAALKAAGKQPVVCRSSPGFIVPRLQTLVMNEAARMVEDGVATAEEIDRAVRYGFGFRFAEIGPLEFIDWGGCDILSMASAYLTQALGDEKFAAAPMVRANMAAHRRGLRDGRGFYDYAERDVSAWREDVLRRMAARLRGLS